MAKEVLMLSENQPAVKKIDSGNVFMLIETLVISLDSLTLIIISLNGCLFYPFKH